VQKIVESAKVYYSRDSLWRRLIASVKSAAVGGIPLENSFTLVDFQMLSTRYHTQPILAIDPDLAELFSIREFNWSFGLDELNKRYYWVAREFRECRKIGEAINSDLIDYPGRKLRHLLLLNPQNSDFVIHFELDSESNLLKVNAVSREVRELSRSHKHIRPTSTSIGTIELEFLSDIARTVSYLMSSQL
jgi:hypothetical protein